MYLSILKKNVASFDIFCAISRIFCYTKNICYPCKEDYPNGKSLHTNSRNHDAPRGTDLSKWAVIACDQYTSQPDYWAETDRPSVTHPLLCV